MACICVQQADTQASAHKHFNEIKLFDCVQVCKFGLLCMLIKFKTDLFDFMGMDSSGWV